MELEKLSNFLKSEMVDSSNFVENFNKSIDQLLYECANMKMSNWNNNPKQLCEDCTAELVMVAKFREKCGMSDVALEQLKRQINKMSKAEKIVSAQLEKNVESENHTENSNSETIYENIEYAEDNVEYVIYDSSADFVEETDIIEQPSEDLGKDESVDNNQEDEQIDKRETISSKRKVSKALRTRIESRKAKHAPSKAALKSIIKHHCILCGAGFAQLNNFTRHLQTHNEHDIESHLSSMIEEKPCEVEIRIEENVSLESESVEKVLEDEVKARKTVQKNHACHYCGRGFPSSSLLATHIRIHTGERPYSCNICSRRLSSSQTHLFWFVIGERPHRCEICLKGFIKSSGLTQHMRRHIRSVPVHKNLSTDAGAIEEDGQMEVIEIEQNREISTNPENVMICFKEYNANEETFDEYM